MCLEVPVSTGTFLFNFNAMKILALLLLFCCSFANAQDCSTLIKCYGDKCYQQDTVRGYVAGHKTSIPKIWLSSSDTNFYLNIVFTDTISGENIKLTEPHDIRFMFCCDGKSTEGHKYMIEESYYCNYSGCVVHKIPLSRFGNTAKLYSLFSQSILDGIDLYELDRRQAFRDGDMMSDGVFDFVCTSRLKPAEWMKLKEVLGCMMTAK